jgi:Rrf2 family transcriptional regulator, iron-sulfur cluster assembly transcription factor
MKLSKKLEAALNAVNTLGSRTEPTRTEDLAKEIGITIPFLEQITRDLRIAGILKVKRGPGGGYLRNLDMGDISCLDVSKAIGRDFEVREGTTASDRLAKLIESTFRSLKI